MSRLETNRLAVLGAMYSRERGGKGGSPQMAIRRGQRNGVIRGRQASHKFWGQQNCSPPWMWITHTMPLAVPVSQRSRRC